MAVVIYYHPEAYSTGGPKLMGRNAAGEAFLRAHLAYGRAGTQWALVENPDHGQGFVQAVRQAGRTDAVTVLDRTTLSGLAQAGCLYHPGPDMAAHAWKRAAFGPASWSLCGITHTTASARVMDALAALTTAPFKPWDVLVCTSSAVRANVGNVLGAQAEYLKARLGATRLVLPRLELIPLGVHTGDFDYDRDRRAAARAALGLGPDDLAVVFVGRLSFHAKAHPLAMYQALEVASRRLPATASVVLVECGWHANEAIGESFAEAARLACPGVRVVTLDGRRAGERQTAWAGADVFCSLADNIQETFGLTPVEAMAAGLPVVVSDWDGYRDTVRDGVDGFRVPTLMPPPGLGTDIALRHGLEIDSYDMYCAQSCAFVSVDIGAAVEAFTRLFTSAELRRAMGEAGRRRARELYDWSVIIARYEALWDELAHMRREAGEAGKPALWPARMDPFACFSGYATAALAPDMMLAPCVSDAGAAMERLGALRALDMVGYATPLMPTDEECERIFAALATGPQPAGTLAAGFAPERQGQVFRSLCWLMKLGLLRLAGTQPGAGRD